jgi:hypothetical protein
MFTQLQLIKGLNINYLDGEFDYKIVKIKYWKEDKPLRGQCAV